MQTPRELWQEQCEAARGVRERFGVQAAFDYILDEKLQLFAESAERDRRLAADLPWFVAEARKLFTADEIEHHFRRLERKLADEAEFVGDPDDEDAERPEDYQTRVNRFQKIAEFMRTLVLGTS